VVSVRVAQRVLNQKGFSKMSDCPWRLHVSSPARRRPNRYLSLIALLGVAASAACSSSPTSPTTSGAISGVSLSAGSVVPGSAVTGTITLSQGAPTGGASVVLASSDTAVTVPAVVIVPAGATTQTFEVATFETSSITTVTVTASYGGASRTATLAVGRPVLQSLSLSASDVAGGTVLTGTVTLATAAPNGGTPIVLVSSGGLVTLPGSVTVPEGSTTLSFDVQTIEAPSPYAVTLTASYADVTVAATLTIQSQRLESLIGIPDQVPGGIAFQGKVAVTMPAPADGTTVLLASDNPAVSVPGAVTLSAGATTGLFDIVTVNPPVSVAATITATYAGVSRSARMTVVPLPEISRVSCSPSSVVGGTSVQCVGTLRDAAPASGWILALTSSDSSFELPQSLTIPAGGSSFQFNVATASVSSGEWVSIKVSDARSGAILFGTTIYVTTS
jgi:trimeric autotransporter adhesin